MPTPAPPVRPDEEPSAGPPRNHSQATSALVVAIVGLLIFGIILGPLAIYLGTNARNDIEASNGQLLGLGKAKAAIVIGIIATVLWAITLIASVTAA